MQHKPIVCYRYVISYHTVLSLLVSFNKDLEGELSIYECLSCLFTAGWHLIVSRDQKRQMKECDENATFAVTMWIKVPSPTVKPSGERNDRTATRPNGLKSRDLKNSTQA